MNSVPPASPHRPLVPSSTESRTWVANPPSALESQRSLGGKWQGLMAHPASGWPSPLDPAPALHPENIRLGRVGSVSLHHDRGPRPPGHGNPRPGHGPLVMEPSHIPRQDSTGWWGCRVPAPAQLSLAQVWHGQGTRPAPRMGLAQAGLRPKPGLPGPTRTMP